MVVKPKDAPEEVRIQVGNIIVARSRNDDSLRMAAQRKLVEMGWYYAEETKVLLYLGGG